MTNELPEPDDLLSTLRILRRRRRSVDRGEWIYERIGDYRFDALVFPGPAQHRAWEVEGDSQISKLCVYDDHRCTLYNWDRGADVPPANPTVERIVGLLAAGLADAIFLSTDSSDRGPEMQP